MCQGLDSMLETTELFMDLLSMKWGEMKVPLVHALWMMNLLNFQTMGLADSFSSYAFWDDCSLLILWIHAIILLNSTFEELSDFIYLIQVESEKL